VQRAEAAERAAMEMRAQVEQVRSAPDLEVTLDLLEKQHATALSRVEEAERAARELRAQVEHARQVAQKTQSPTGDEQGDGVGVRKNPASETA
jgi:hypothetical protein